MEKILNDYLEKVEKYLKPMAVGERVDIVKEIKSEMLELQSNGKTPEEISERLGAPKELAKAYLGDLLEKDTKFSWNKFLTVCAFYSVVGFSGIFIIPSLLIIAPAFLASGVIAPFLAAVKMADYLFHLGIPYMENIGIVLTGIIELNPVGEFIAALLIGILLCQAGRGAWKLLVMYCRAVSRTHRALL